ncbi:hypothetical protein [Lysobacter panacisoli]|uniref:DUF3618 domain-containing protein n=1 Tax=Lysobacter panacisoli TaxID=1255263 RepID=A0ABP9LND8_9GAMM|nr:hypothetical protein [Lysobacter panacisoli]
MFGPSRATLERQLAELESAISARGLALVGDGATPERLLADLHPLTTRSVELKRRIRQKTPWRTLAKRRDELKRTLAALPPGRERQRAEIEFLDLDSYLTLNPKRRPMTLIALVLFAAVVFVMVVLPPLVVDWLAP